MKSEPEKLFSLKGKPISKSLNPPALSFDQLIKQWNAIPGVGHCLKPTESRKRSFRARSKDPNWLENVNLALDRVVKSGFLRGQNDRGWKADIDWFLKPDSLTRILEGKYDDDKNNSRSTRPIDGRRVRDWSDLE